MAEKILTKPEIIDAISEEAGITKAQAERALEATIKTIRNGLAAGKDLTLNNFATFKVEVQKGRSGVSALTKKPYTTEDKNVVKIKPLPAFKDQVKDGTQI